jgi:hypothetical protein
MGYRSPACSMLEGQAAVATSLGSGGFDLDEDVRVE